MSAKPSPEMQVREWYIRYSPMVLRRCRKLLGDRDLAHDAMHDVFARILQMNNLDRVDNAAKYLFRTTTHVCIDHIRSRKHRCSENGDILSRIACADDTESRTLAGLILEKIFSRQKPDTREIAIMVHLDRMSYREIALALGISVSTIKNRLNDLQRFLSGGGK